ncbi:uncharacterized protein LOC141655586 [Silene latifolia]|uniref:uncharacterized protein LOC141655586 n=1 Tax=Silene latifolia TaxID=37657 RepID=UPI003D7897E9
MVRQRGLRFKVQGSKRKAVRGQIHKWFGYAVVNDDYKIAAIDENHIAIFHWRDKSWCNFDNSRMDYVASVRGGRLDLAVYDNHLCLWLFWCGLQNKHRIVCFDLLIENWTQDIPLPNCNVDNSVDNPGIKQHFAEMLFDEGRDKRNDLIALHVLDGFLSVLSQSNTGNDGYDVWAMKEYGIKESWVKLFGFSDWREEES